jgi:hypothetical protein
MFSLAWRDIARLACVAALWLIGGDSADMFPKD